MKTRILLLSFLCLSLAACGGRRREQPTETSVPAPVVATSAPTSAPVVQPTEAAPQPTSTLVVQPTQESATAVSPTETEAAPAPTSTVAAESDPSGDQLEAQLDQLNTQNAADEQDVNNLPNP
jgi:hypothetical protein